MVEEGLANQPFNVGDAEEEIDEPDSAFIINKNFKGVRKKFKGSNIDTTNVRSFNSNPGSENEFETWGSTSSKTFSVDPEFQTHSQVMWNHAGDSHLK